MFNVVRDKLDNFDRVTMLNSKTGEHVSIITTYGGNIDRLVLMKNNELFSILDTDTSEKELTGNCCFKSAKLFPFPNRIRDGKYKFDGKVFQLPINEIDKNNAIHGLVFDKPFNVLSIKEAEDYSCIILEYDSKDEFRGFPFSFKLSISYTLSEKGLEINTTAINCGNTNMPLGDGWHPYFKFNEKVEELFLQIPSSNRIIVDSNMIPTGAIVKEYKYDNVSLIGNDYLDEGYYIENSKIAVTKLYSEKRDVCINLWQEATKEKYNYLQIYIPPHRNSIAIEPMSCNTNAFNNGEGLLVLKPDESFEAGYGVYID